MVQVLNRTGFDCRHRVDDLLGAIVQCNRGTSSVEIIPDYGVIEFDCHAHAACDLSQEEAVEQLIAQGVIDTADPSGNDYYGNLLYCADGTQGDALCVDSAGSVILYRAQLKSVSRDQE